MFATIWSAVGRFGGPPSTINIINDLASRFGPSQTNDIEKDLMLPTRKLETQINKHATK
jgi:hypothetical protein